MCAPCTMQTHIITHPHIAYRVFTCALALVAAAGWAGAGAMTRRPIPQTNYRYPNNKSRRHPECANTFPSISGRPLTRPYMLYTEPICSCRYRCTSTRGKTHTTCWELDKFWRWLVLRNKLLCFKSTHACQSNEQTPGRKKKSTFGDRQAHKYIWTITPATQNT